MFRGYGDDYLQVEDQRYYSSLLLHSGQVSAPWGVEKLEEITLPQLQTILEAPPEIVIIGTGRTTRFPSNEVLAALKDGHIGFECMDSRSAARTYNILVTEGRETSAAMLLPSA